MAADPAKDEWLKAVGPYIEGRYTVRIPWRAFVSYLSPEGRAVFGGNPVKDKTDEE